MVNTIFVTSVFIIELLKMECFYRNMRFLKGKESNSLNFNINKFIFENKGVCSVSILKVQ